jgi:hypothetical protein
MEGLYQELAESYARGMLPETANAADGAGLIEQARAVGLKLRRDFHRGEYRDGTLGGHRGVQSAREPV